MLNYSPQIPNDSRWELLEAINANRPPDVPPCGYFRGRMAEKNKLKTPSRFYHDVGKFVPEVPAPWRDIRGPRKSSEADSSPPTQNNDCLQGSYL